MANITYKEDIDHRQIENTPSEPHRKYLKELFEYWINASEDELRATGMHDIWQRNAYYAESFQVPVGMSDEYLKEYVKGNNGRLDTKQFKVKKNKKNQIFFVDNKIGPIKNGYKAEFTKAKKVISSKADNNPKNDRLESAYKNFTSKYEKEHRIWENIRTPAIDYMLTYGLAWTNLTFNPFINWPIGDIDMEYYHPKDVLVDTNATNKYFLGARYVIRKKKVELNEARRFFKRYGVKAETVQPDKDYDYSSYVYKGDDNRAYSDLFVTIYFVEYRMTYTDMITGDAEFGIPLVDNEEDAGEEDRVYYFKAIYNKNTGVVHHAINKYADPRKTLEWQFDTIPWFDEPSETRIYPISRVEKLTNIQDIVNITESVILDSARQRNIIRIAVKKKLRDKYGETYDKWEAYGGSLPVDEEEDISKAIKTVESPDIDPSIFSWLEIVERSLSNQALRKEVLQGQLPAKYEYLSGKSLKELKESNATLLSPIDQNINWAATTEGNLFARIIGEEYEASEWVDIEDAKQNDPKFIPVNMTMTGLEFETYISMAYPNMDLRQAIAKFDENNYVETVINLPEEERPFVDPEIIKSDFTDVHINYFKDWNGKAFKMNMRIEIDFDTEDNEFEDKMLATELLKNGKFPYEIWLEMQGGIFTARKDEILEKLREENQLQQMADEIAKRGPEFFQLVQNLAMEYDARKQMKDKLPAPTAPQPQPRMAA